MALVKYGSLVTELKGKVGGQVFQGSMYGPILRNEYKGSTKRSYVSTEANMVISELAAEWNELSNEQRQGWSDNAWMFPVLDKFGNTMVLDGYNCFVHLNFILAEFGETLIENVPSENAGPHIYEVTGTIHYDLEQFDLDFTDTPVATDEMLIVDLYAPVKTAREESRRKRRKKREAKDDAEASPFDVYEPYDEQMHGPLRTALQGWFVPVEWFSVNKLNGVRSAVQITFVEINN